MSLYTPGRRWQPAFYPFKKTSPSKRILTFTERKIKGILFGCRMCGNCLLQETAFICPMECPKGLRNGPCGGSSKEHCYVDISRPCIWYRIYKKAERKQRETRLLEVFPPLDWNKTGTETWSEVYSKIKQAGFRRVISIKFSKNKTRKAELHNFIFRSIRQPDWWGGDSEYHEKSYTEPISQLERSLKEGKFVVTSEIAPPKSIATGNLIKNIELIKPYATALNFTDSPSATPSVSSIACCKITIDCGAEPVLQIAGRDITRIALQSQALGASAIGVRNILCLTGDSAIQGSPPVANMNIFDVDAVQMLWILRKMRDEGKYLSGFPIKFPPKYFLGAGGAPFASEPKIQAQREKKKINAGAQFLQTNLVYDPDGLEEWLNELVKINIRNKAYILAGITPLKSSKMAQFLNSDVPGVIIPQKYLDRMEKAGENAETEGIAIAVELINEIKSRNIVDGIHIMAIGWESIVPKILSETGLVERNGSM